MKLEQSEREFADITKNIRIEIRRFEMHRKNEFRKILTCHIESLIKHEQEVGNIGFQGELVTMYDYKLKLYVFINSKHNLNHLFKIYMQ